MHLISLIYQDIESFFVKFFKYIKKKYNNKKIITKKNDKSMNIDGTNINGYDFLNIYEKNKIKELINYFQI